MVMLGRRDATRTDLALTEAFALIRSNGTYQFIIERTWKVDAAEL
jgi:hypothetical protein